MELPPEQFMQGMRAMEGIRQADQQKLMQGQLANQQATLANQFAQQNNPIKQQQAEFNLSRDQQTLPGVLAQSRGLVRAEDQAGDLTPDKLPAALTMAAAMAGQPGMQTPALHGQMRKILKNAYVPEIMDAWTPQQFGANLGEMVKRFSEFQPKQMGAERIQEMKDKAAFEREQEKTKRGESIARVQAAAKKATSNNAPKDPKTLGEYAARLFRQADALSGPGASEEDLARAEVIAAQANEYQRRFEQYRLNEKVAVGGGAIDPGALTNADGTPRFPTKPKVVPTTPAGPTKAPTGVPPPLDANGQAEYEAWKKANGLK